jgi:hypothetical protein
VGLTVVLMVVAPTRVVGLTVVLMVVAPTPVVVPMVVAPMVVALMVVRTARGAWSARSVSVVERVGH